MLGEIHGRSEIGVVRSLNEDYWKAAPEVCAAVVADGVGGSPCGEVASKITADAIVEYLEDPAEELPADQRLLEAFREANRRVRDHAAGDEACQGMASTAVACSWDGRRLIAANAGDSRAYLFREGKLRQLSYDHTLGNELARRLGADGAGAAASKVGHVLTMAVGTSEDILVHHVEVELEAGDQILLTTDGVHGSLADERLTEILVAGDEPQSTLDMLVTGALEAGSRDNVTAVLIGFAE